MTEYLIVLSTFPDEAGAARAVRALVEERLAASGNIVPGVRSIYHWEGAVADRPEVMVILHTRKQDWAALMSRLHELHPYEVPKCVAVRVAAGAPKFMAWLDETLSAGDAR